VPPTDPLREKLQTTLGSAYVLARELPAGGMSRVFVARETALGRDVVVKVLPPEMVGELSIERFTREIQLAAKLQHPHIVPLLSAADAQGLLYFTMPLVRGETLRERLSRDGPLPIGETTRILREVLDALAHAHEHGVVHRDIKPENILLTRGHALVMDFGIAKALDSATHGAATTLTSAGTAVGTMAYTAPEQAAGDPETDHRADLYSVGVVGYEMLTGQSPFGGRSLQATIVAHAVERPEPVETRRADTPLPLAALVNRCLEKQPADRPATAEDALREIESLTSSGIATAPSWTPWRRRRLPRWVRFSAVVVIAALVTAGGAVAFLPRSSRATVLTLLSRGSAVLVTRRVVVAPFENRTGDPAFDRLGDMTADWIAQGLSRVPEVEVVDARTALVTSRVVANIPTLLRTSNNARALAEEVGAATVVLGSFYLDSDSLRFQTQIIDVRSGRPVRAVEPVSGSVNAPGAVVERLREHAVGALAPLLDSTITGWGASTAPPSYAAYREFALGLESFMHGGPSSDSVADAHYARAAALDTTYGIPLVGAAFSHVNRAAYLIPGAWLKADSVARLAERRRRWLSAGDAALLDYVEASITGNAAEMLRSAQDALRLFPGSVEIPLLASSAASRFGRQRLALAMLRRTDPLRGLNLASTLYWAQVRIPLHLLGEFKALADTMRAARRQFPESREVAEWLCLSFAALGKADEVERLLATDPVLARGRRDDAGLNTALKAVRELRWHGHDAAAERIVARLAGEQRVSPLDTSGPSGTGRKAALLHLRIAAGQWKDARAIAEWLARRDTNDVDALSLVGAAAAHDGDRAEAERISAVIERRTSREALGHAFEVAHGAFLRARIAVGLGNRDAAVAMLARATAEGRYHPWNVHDDMFAELFVPLRDHAPFQQLMSPAR
jgi:serine/threonine-protein kinase